MKREALRSPFPVLLELGTVNEKPLENGRQRASRKPALDDAAVDPDGDLEFPVFRVEVRWKREIIAGVHPNYTIPRKRDSSGTAEW